MLAQRIKIINAHIIYLRNWFIKFIKVIYQANLLKILLWIFPKVPEFVVYKTPEIIKKKIVTFLGGKRQVMLIFKK